MSWDGWRWPRRRRPGAVRAAAIVVASLSLAGCWWQQPDFGPAHQRWNPFERTLTAETVAAAQVQWTVVVDGPSDMFEPITDGESVYVTLQLNLADAVRAYDVDTGAQVWNRNLPSSGAPTTVRAVPVAFSGDELVVSQLARFPTTVADCVDQNRLDPETGAVLGVTRTEFATSPLVTAASIRAQTTSGRCVADTSMGRLRVDDATSGAAWTADLGPETFAAPAVSLAEDLLYVNDHGVVRAYTASGCGSPSCAPLWSVAVPGFVGPVLVADGVVFAFENVVDVAPAPPDPGLHHGAVIALDARTGAEVWRSTYGGPADGTSGQVYGIAASGDTLYVSATSRYVSGPHEGQLDAYPIGGCGGPACAPAWSAALDVPWPSTSSGRLPYVSPVVAGDVVYAADAAGVVAFDTGGTRLVTLPLDDPPAWIAVSAGHVLAVVDTSSASLTAFGLP